MSTAERLALALEALVKNEGLDVFVYLDKGIGSSTKAGQRWLEARAAVAAYRSTPADGGGQGVTPLTEDERRKLWRESHFRGNGGQIDWFIEGTKAAERWHRIGTPASKDEA